MSTFGSLIADVKTSVRQTTTEMDAFLLSRSAMIWRDLLRSDNWPQQRTTADPISIVSGTQAYDLPEDFDHFAGDRVNYYQSGTQFSAMTIPILRRGSQMNDTRASTWEVISATTNATYPRVVGVQPGGANTYQLVLYPLAGTTGDTLTFDYYAIPQRSEITTGAVITVDQLYETLFNMLATEHMRFLNNQQQFQYFAQLAALSHKAARLTLRTL